MVSDPKESRSGGQKTKQSQHWVSMLPGGLKGFCYGKVSLGACTCMYTSNESFSLSRSTRGLSRRCLSKMTRCEKAPQGSALTDLGAEVQDEVGKRDFPWKLIIPRPNILACRNKSLQREMYVHLVSCLTNWYI